MNRPNKPVERTVGSHSLAATAHWQRSPHSVKVLQGRIDGW
jgi:hypothetical protein